jgi:hypothetical protein
MADETFEGAEVDGKRFPFIRISVAMEPKLIKKFLPSTIDAVLNKLFPLTANMRAWKKVRRIALQKDWKWKYLGIIPKELRCSNIKIQVAGGIQADFFAYVTTNHEEFKKLFDSVNNSQTTSESAKPSD